MYQNKSISSSIILGIALAAICVTAGCEKAAPESMPVSGTVLLRGKPLPNAEVKFVPMMDVDANFIATGISDDEGKFTLKLRGNQEDPSSCCLGQHKIMVSEGPMPEGARGMDEAAQQIVIKHQKSLKNRPIPRDYSSVGSSPLTIEVTADKSEYLLELVGDK